MNEGAPFSYDVHLCQARGTGSGVRPLAEMLRRDGLGRLLRSGGQAGRRRSGSRSLAGAPPLLFRALRRRRMAASRSGLAALPRPGRPRPALPAAAPRRWRRCRRRSRTSSTSTWQATAHRDYPMLLKPAGRRPAGHSGRRRAWPSGLFAWPHGNHPRGGLQPRRQPRWPFRLGRQDLAPVESRHRDLPAGLRGPRQHRLERRLQPGRPPGALGLLRQGRDPLGSRERQAAPAFSGAEPDLVRRLRPGRRTGLHRLLG